MPTKTAETVHGSVEYETVECDSCGNETVKDDAKDFQIGDREGKACEHCYKEGPISFPEKTKERLGLESDDVFFGMVLWPLAFVILLTDPEGGSRPFIVASIGACLWTTSVFGLWWFL